MTATHPPITSQDFLTFLHLPRTETGIWSTRTLDHNQNGRVFGGQLLGHAVTAALGSAPQRHLSSLRLGFLQGALPDAPLEWQVTPLQQGSRYTNCHLRATQGTRVIADAQVTLQVPGQGFEHSDTMPDGLPAPEDCPTLHALEHRITERTGLHYTLQLRPFLDVRLLDADDYLLAPAPQHKLRYWVKARDPLPDDPAIHAAALAYLSDFWFNYTSLATHMGLLGSRDRIYVSSLNHTLWSYEPCRADEWLLFDCTSPRATDGRGLALAQVYTQDGRLVACAAQEIVCGPLASQA